MCWQVRIQMKEKAEFPMQMQPVELVQSQAKLEQVAVKDTDLCIVYAARGCTEWPLTVPMVMFVRHRSGRRLMEARSNPLK
jgi:hypothetical protein